MKEELSKRIDVIKDLNMEGLLKIEEILSELKTTNTMLFLAGVTASGKTHLSDKLCSYFPNHFEKVRQVTTRTKRIGEGDAYDFISVEAYRKLLDENKLFATTEFNGNFYGTKKPSTGSELIRIVIVNKQGLLDDNSELDCNILKVGIYSSLSTVRDRLKLNDMSDIAASERAKRDIGEEFSVYSHCDDIIANEDGTELISLIKDLLKSIHRNYFEIKGNEDATVQD